MQIWFIDQSDVNLIIDHVSSVLKRFIDPLSSGREIDTATKMNRRSNVGQVRANYIQPNKLHFCLRRYEVSN